MSLVACTLSKKNDIQYLGNQKASKKTQLIETNVRSPTSVFIHSVVCLMMGPYLASSKASSPQSKIQCFLFQFTVSSLVLNVIQQLLTSSSSYCRHFYPSPYLSNSNVCSKAVPMQDVINPASVPYLYCMQDIPVLLECMQYFFVSHTMVKLTFSILFQNHTSKLSKHF